MKSKALKIAIPVVLILGLTWLMMGMPPAARVGYGPEQPIHYSHKKHAGEMKIDCQYCHTTVAMGRKAGVPSLSVCMNCHNNVGLDGFPELDKLRDNFWNENKSPEWIRIHNLPDHVKFSHAPHIKALLQPGHPSKEACMPCHGNIAEMQVVSQVESLNMGFCISCHRDNKALGAKTNCSTCHY